MRQLAFLVLHLPRDGAEAVQAVNCTLKYFTELRSWSVSAYLVRKGQGQLDLCHRVSHDKWFRGDKGLASTLSGTASAYVLRCAAAREAIGRARRATRAKRMEFMINRGST